jgi:hypothetical protein
LYFIYQTDIKVARKLNTAPDRSPYSTLVKVFRIAEDEGWDTARLSWLHKHHSLENVAQKENLFGSVDEQVFCFLKSEQYYSYQIECSRAECKNKIRTRTTTEVTVW